MGESLGFLTDAFAAGGPAAAPAFGTAGTYKASGSGTSLALAVPASVAANDILLAFMYIENQTPDISGFPTGWAYHPDMPYTIVAPMNHRLLVAWKRATGADSGTYTFTLSASAAFSEGQVLRYTNCKLTGSPFDTPSGGNVVVAQNSVNANASPSVNVDSLGANRMFLHAASNWGGGTWTPNTGYTKRIQGGAGVITASEKVQATAANSGGLVATCTSSDKSTAFVTALIGN